MPASQAGQDKTGKNLPKNKRIDHLTWGWMEGYVATQEGTLMRKRCFVVVVVDGDKRGTAEFWDLLK